MVFPRTLTISDGNLFVNFLVLYPVVRVELSEAVIAPSCGYLSPLSDPKIDAESSRTVFVSRDGSKAFQQSLRFALVDGVPRPASAVCQHLTASRAGT